MSTEAVNYVFDRLAAAYGAAWDRSLGQAPIADVKTVWADCLSSFIHSDAAKRSIMWALQNLPDRVPNAMEFRNLCRHAPAVKVEVLPEPKADPARVEAELKKLAPLRAKVGVASRVDDKAWAKRLQERDKAGEPLNMNQRRCYKIALDLVAV